MSVRTVLVATVAALLVPQLAFACGGLFCDSIAPAPVEQSGERILFEVDTEAGTVTTTVDITFQGDPSSFAWILPIPVSDEMPVPDLAIAPPSLLRDLELATQPSIIPPDTKCTSAPDPPGPYASGDDDDDDFADSDGVDVIDLPSVGPFDNELIQSADAGALMEWLSANGYLVTPAMEPALADYVGGGLAFLGVKLLPDATTDEIAPLSITWPGTEPMIPLRLTSISAEPEMGLLVFIAADRAYESLNWTTMELDKDNLQWNPVRNQSNYQGLLSYQLDQVGGQGFVVEQAEFSSNLSPQGASSNRLRELFDGTDVVTRLHGRAHPEEMVSDPVFSVGEGSFDGIFDLSGRVRIETCDGAKRTPVPCGDTYCGVGGLCASTARGIDGCVCDSGFVARVVQNPPRPGVAERDTVVCQDASVDFLAEFGPSEADVCGLNTCGGNGDCVAVNGFATCRCDDGYAAVAFGGGPPICDVARTVYPANRIANWSAPGCAGGCSAQGRSGGGLFALLGLLFALGQRARARRSL